MPFAVRIGIAKLRQLAPIQHQSIFCCSHDTHIGFQNLRTVILHKAQKLKLLEPVFFSLMQHFRNLLKGTEHDHTRSAFFTFGRLIFEQPGRKVHKFRNIEREICVERRFSCFAALTVLIVAVNIPIGTACVKVSADIVRNIGDYKLGFRDIVAFEILEIIVIEFTFYISH